MNDEKSPTEAEATRLNLAVQTRQFEIDLFWKRSLFFWGFTAAAAVGFVASLDKAKGLATGIATFGAVCSFAWTLLNRGSKYWQENWEQKVNNSEKPVTGAFFAVQEPLLHKGWFSAARFSVSKLAIALSDFVFVLWFLAAINQVLVSLDYALPEKQRPWAEVALFLFGVGYMVWMFVGCRSTEEDVRPGKVGRSGGVDAKVLPSTAVPADPNIQTVASKQRT